MIPEHIKLLLDSNPTRVTLAREPFGVSEFTIEFPDAIYDVRARADYFNLSVLRAYLNSTGYAPDDVAGKSYTKVA